MRALAIIGLMLWPALSSAFLPDVDRGVAAYEAGDLEVAERNLLPLARQGYAEAQHYLARVYATRDTEASRGKAIHWYRRCLEAYPTDIYRLAKLEYRRSGDPEILREAEATLNRERDRGNDRALSRLIRLYRDFPQLAKAERIGELLDTALAKEDPDLTATVISWYRENVEFGDNRRALFELCVQYYELVPDCRPHLLRAARANENLELVRQDVDAALSLFPAEIEADELDEMASTLLEDDLGAPPLPGQALRLLRVAAQHDTRALARMGTLLLDRPDLVEEGEAPVEILEKASKAGSAQAKLTLGRAYMNGDGVEINPELAKRYLSAAAASLPAGKFSLARYYMRGFEGDGGHQFAVDLMLAAARDGYRRADLELARLFSERVGIKAKPEYAYSFALLAARNEVEGSDLMLDQLRERFGDAVLRAGKALSEREYRARAGAEVGGTGLASNAGTHMNNGRAE